MWNIRKGGIGSVHTAQYIRKSGMPAGLRGDPGAELGFGAAKMWNIRKNGIGPMHAAQYIHKSGMPAGVGGTLGQSAKIWGCQNVEQSQKWNWVHAHRPIHS